MKNKVIKILFVIFLTMILGIIYKNNIYAASTSYDIDAINESKYPGIKNSLKSIQSKHPNWKIKVLYTGLDWNSVIAGEYVGHGGSPSNLIYDTYSEGWRCPICGERKYDVSKRWYCASKEAIEYMIDPRNSLDEAYIFQFQDLASSVGDRSAIEKMVEGTFLNVPSYIDAIMEAAETENISPFHIVARIRQEQGVNGAGAMNGYIYRTESGEFVKVYNLFNINVSGNNTEEGLLAGAKYAYEQGWTTAEASIKGGAKFIKDGYINEGQTTLYFQKFDVIQKGGLYNHQYMQNVRAANDEGNTMYQTYKKNEILNSSFEFTIPLYENMPKQAIPRPTDNYKGSINTELIDINVIESDGNNFISGYIYIAEWVNGECRTPRGIPKIMLKSTDGTFSTDLYVGYEEGIKYYFDKNIEGLDTEKQYYIEAVLTSTQNVENINSKTQRVQLKDKVLKENYKGKTIKIVNNKITFSNGTYEGTINTELIDINIIQNSIGENYISGYVYIAEWIGENCTTPKAIPEVRIKSTDGTVNELAYVGYEGSIEYYFDKNIENYDLLKQYYIEAKLVSEGNIASEKSKIQRIYLGNKTVGKFKGRDITVVSQDDIFKLKYKGNINTELIDINLIESSGNNYISGYMYIAEWIDGECKTPNILPKLYLKSTDGKVNLEMYVGYEEGIKYYFDKCLEGLDIAKEYYIEAQLVNEDNISIYKSQTVRIPDQRIGEKGSMIVDAKDNKIKIQDSSLYYGTINTELYDMKIIQNGTGDNFISGYIYIAEWVNGECRTPSNMPKMYLKSTDGKVEMEMYVGYEGGIKYYFDKCIEGLDTNKEYYIEAKLTNPKNQADKESQKQTAKITKQGEIGICTNGNKVMVSENKIKIQDGSLYYGTINTELYDMKIIQNGTGDNFISGYIYIAEWVNGECRTPSNMPKMYLKSTDGKVEMEMYVGYEGGIKYYFDKCIEGLDTNKEYYIEAKLTNPKNQADKESQKQTAKITKQGEIGICTNGNKVIVNGNNIKIQEQTKNIILKQDTENAKEKQENKEEYIEEKEKINKEDEVKSEGIDTEEKIDNDIDEKMII